MAGRFSESARTIGVNRPYLLGTRGLCRSFSGRGNASIADRLTAEAPLAACRSFPRLRTVVQCVSPRRDGYVHPESLRGVLVEPAPNQQERFPFYRPYRR